MKHDVHKSRTGTEVQDHGWSDGRNSNSLLLGYHRSISTSVQLVLRAWCSRARRRWQSQGRRLSTPHREFIPARFKSSMVIALYFVPGPRQSWSGSPSADWRSCDGLWQEPFLLITQLWLPFFFLERHRLAFLNSFKDLLSIREKLPRCRHLCQGSSSVRSTCPLFR
jgi:hypothetical protein